MKSRICKGLQNRRIFLIIVVICILANPVGYSQLRNVPKLVILISVDQMSPDYFERFSPFLDGGLKELYSKGIVYKNCNLDYAYTETVPGHATMSTGCFPMKHGIFLNDWYDPRTFRSVNCVRDTTSKPINGLGGNCSPINLKQTTIGDWLKVVSPLSRVVSLSIKDRAAVLMGGYRPDVVCWYSKEAGKFVSSSYYGQQLPGFVQKFNDSDFLGTLPSSWEKLTSSCDAMTSPDSMEGETLWLGKSTMFPHPLPANSRRSLLQFTPFGDSLVLVLALDAVQEMQLGKRTIPDLLCISLSSTDYIGHYFGPNSVEMCDQIERLDLYLGKFLQELDSEIGSGNYVVALTSDHSVNPLPEYATKYLHLPKPRLVEEYDAKPAIERADSTLKQQLNISKTLIDPKGFLAYETALDAGLSPIEFEHMVYKVLRDLNFVKDVFFRRELVDTNYQKNRPHLAEFRRSYDIRNGPDFVIDYKDRYLVTDKNYPVNHGYFCMHVPLIFWSSKAEPLNVLRHVQSIDIAPTLARVLGVPSPPWIDGKSLKEVTDKFVR